MTDTDPARPSYAPRLSHLLPLLLVYLGLQSALHAVELQLPEGFTATRFAADLGNGRHLAVAASGVVYVSLRRASDGHHLVALQDTDGDGRADEQAYFGRYEGGGGTGIAIHEGFLYYASVTQVYRVALPEAGLLPEAEPEVIVSGFPAQRGHDAKGLTFDGQGHLYVSVGAPSNACQKPQRTPGVAGQQPCPELEWQGGIWRFDAERPGQTQRVDGERFATGLRHPFALDWYAPANALVSVPHGRDQLDSLFPEFYTPQENAELPGEELHLLRQGSDAGWPYTYWNPMRNARIVAPEYGGDAQRTAPEGRYQDPLMAFPAHWAPNDLVVYTGDAFPQKYRNGVFVAFHGSWNRAPEPQRGYCVAFQAMDGEGIAGDYEVFATGFAGREVIDSPRQARHRPCGVAVGPDGALYVVDSKQGHVWRITYTGAAAEASGGDGD